MLGMYFMFVLKIYANNKIKSWKIDPLMDFTFTNIYWSCIRANHHENAHFVSWMYDQQDTSSFYRRMKRLQIQFCKSWNFSSVFFFLASSLSMDFDDESLQHSTFFSSDSNSSFRTHRFEIFRLRWKLLGVLFSYGLSKIILQSCFIYYYQGCKNYNRISQLFRGLLSIEITY